MSGPPAYRQPEGPLPGPGDKEARAPGGGGAGGLSGQAEGGEAGS